MASIKNISLRFFISNKAELLSFELISELSDIEMQSNLLAKKIERFADFAYENVNASEREVKIKFTYLLADIIDGEETLLASYERFIDKNKTYLNKKSE